MKKSKLLLGTLVVITGILFVTGCGTKDTTTSGSTETKEKETTKLKANCSALECIKKIEPENTVEEVNDIIGVDGTLTDEDNNVYEYDLGNDETITLKYYSGDKATIIASYEKDDLANKDVDLSNIDDLKTKVKSGITYDDFKAEIGGVDGTLVEKSSLSNKYVWVSKKGGNIKASFSISTNKCTYFTGYADTK